MNDNRTGGILLIAGCAAGLTTMALHPVAHHGDPLSPQAMASLLLLNRSVHGLALVGVAAVFLGALALTRRLLDGGRLAVAALVFHGFAAVAIMVAGAMDGFVASDFLGRMAGDSPERETARTLLDYTFRVNQAFAALYVVGTSAAIFLWSLAAVRNHRIAPGLGWYGFGLAPVVILALFSGHLSLGVHGFGLVVLVQSVWFIAAGVLLTRTADSFPG